MYKFVLGFLTLVIPSSGSYCDYGLSVQGLGSVGGKDLDGDYPFNGNVYEKGSLFIYYEGIQEQLPGWTFMDGASKQKEAICWDGCAEPVRTRGGLGWDKGTGKATMWRFEPYFDPPAKMPTISCLKNPKPPTPAPATPPPVPCCRNGIRVQGFGFVVTNHGSVSLDGDYPFDGYRYEKGSFYVYYEGVQEELPGWTFMNEVGKQKLAVCWDGCANPDRLDGGGLCWDKSSSQGTFRVLPRLLPGDAKKISITCLDEFSNATLLV